MCIDKLCGYHDVLHDLSQCAIAKKSYMHVIIVYYIYIHVSTCSVFLYFPMFITIFCVCLISSYVDVQ